MNPWRVEKPILLAVFLDLMGFGMVFADLQLRAQAFVAPGWRVGIVIGILLASTFVTQTLVSPIWGRMSDRVGRKPIVVACGILSAAALLVYGLSTNLWGLQLSRLLSGFGAANVAVAQAAIADVFEGEKRTAAVGRIGAAISAGLVVGPALGGLLATLGGNRLVGFSAAAASALGVLVVAVTFPRVPPRIEDVPSRRSSLHFSLLRDIPALRALVLIAAVSWFSLATLEGTFARLIQKLFGYGQLQFGFLFSYESLLAVVVQGFLLVLIVRSLRDSASLRIGYVVQGLGLALNPLSAALRVVFPPLGTLFIASTLYALGSGVANPTVNSLCSKLTPENRQGELFGLLQSSRSIGFVIGPILGGWLFDLSPGFPYYLACVVCLVAALLVPRL